jgi:hypothetical protein
MKSLILASLISGELNQWEGIDNLLCPSSLFCSLDSSAGDVPNSPYDQATPTIGSTNASENHGSPGEWIFPRLVETTPPGIAREKSAGIRQSVGSLLPDQKELEEWIFSKFFQSDIPHVTTGSSEEVLNKKTSESACYHLPDEFFEMFVENCASSTTSQSSLHASVGVASGIGATPIGDSCIVRGNNSSSDSGSRSQDEKSGSDSSKKQGNSSTDSSWSSESSKASGCSSGVLERRERRRIPISGSEGGVQRAATKSGIPRVTRYI